MKDIILFDIDGTLTKPRKKIEKKMLNILLQLKSKYKIGCISGSDFNKCKEQIGDNILEIFDYSFFENGLVSYKETEILNIQNIKKFLGEYKITQFINYILKYLSELELPIKRGTFIEFRNGIINISPIGRNCSQEERDEFEKFDKENKIRKNMIDVLKKEFENYNLTYSIGGQISFDIFPKGWDKTYCLQFLKEFENIYFFGDKTNKGGNDYELYTSDRTIGFKTIGIDNTIELLRTLY
jgi:phosphomannomutase